MPKWHVTLILCGVDLAKCQKAHLVLIGTDAYRHVALILFIPLISSFGVFSVDLVQSVLQGRKVTIAFLAGLYC